MSFVEVNGNVIKIENEVDFDNDYIDQDLIQEKDNLEKRVLEESKTPQPQPQPQPQPPIALEPTIVNVETVCYQNKQYMFGKLIANILGFPNPYIAINNFVSKENKCEFRELDVATKHLFPNTNLNDKFINDMGILQLFENAPKPTSVKFRLMPKNKIVDSITKLQQPFNQPDTTTCLKSNPQIHHHHHHQETMCLPMFGLSLLKRKHHENDPQHLKNKFAKCSNNAYQCKYEKELIELNKKHNFEIGLKNNKIQEYKKRISILNEIIAFKKKEIQIRDEKFKMEVLHYEEKFKFEKQHNADIFNKLLKSHEMCNEHIKTVSQLCDDRYRLQQEKVYSSLTKN